MSAQRLVPILILAATLGGCSVARQEAGPRFVNSTYRPVAGSTALPARAGNLASCGASGPTGDLPTPKVPATDTVRVSNKELRQLLAAFCAAEPVAPRPNPEGGTTQILGL